jgi:Ankyrin repeats (3 copies)/Ankyrin repeat
MSGPTELAKRSAVLGGFLLSPLLLFVSVQAQDRIQRLEDKIAKDIEMLGESGLKEQKKWDEIRERFFKILYFDLDKEPEEKVIAKLEALFAAGAIIQSYDGEILERPVIKGSKRVTKYLLDKGADPNGFRADSKPLKIATKYGEHDIIKLLNQYGARPLKSAEAAQLRLTFAAFVGDVKSVKQELSRGADINSRDTLDYTTALIGAVLANHLETVKTLISLGADPHQSGHVDSIDFFAPDWPGSENGLPVGMCTPLHAAAIPSGLPERAGDVPEIIRVLLRAGAFVSSTDCYKKLTPLHVAAKFQSAAATNVLLKEGAKVMAKDSDGKTPLDYAESGPVIKLLKAYGARE